MQHLAVFPAGNCRILPVDIPYLVGTKGFALVTLRTSSLVLAAASLYLPDRVERLPPGVSRWRTEQVIRKGAKDQDKE